MQNDFLPENDNKLEMKKSYLRLSQLKDGENKLRIVSKPIGGWLDWEGTRPIRTRPDDKRAPVDPKKPPKGFWAFYVWSYDLQDLFIMEVTQQGVLKTLRSLAKDEDWGDLREYDLKVKKEGSGKETKYSATPMPKKTLSSDIVEALKAKPVFLEALYEGKDPFEEGRKNPTASNFSDLSLEEVAKVVSDHIELDSKEHVGRYIGEIQTRVKEPISSYLKQWLANPVGFSEHYGKWLDKQGIARIKRLA